MSFIPGDGGSGTGETLSVDTEALKVTAPTFQRSGQQVDALLTNLTSDVNMAGGDMFLLLEFAKMASILERLQERIGVAMQCAAGGLKRIGTSLEIASGLYVENEETLTSTFTQLEDDSSAWKMPPIVSPWNPSPLPQPVPTPVAQPQPGIQPQPIKQPPDPTMPIIPVLPLE